MGPCALGYSRLGRKTSGDRPCIEENNRVLPTTTEEEPPEYLDHVDTETLS